MKKFRLILLISLAALVLGEGLSPAQNRRRGKRQNPREASTVTLDSAGIARRDSLLLVEHMKQQKDSLAREDSLSLLSKSSVKVPVFTGAKDSIVDDFSNGNRLRYYYGDVTVEYDDLKLTADYMEYNMKTGVVFARGTLDTLNDEWKGKPVMTQGGETYNMDEISYNFNNRKAKITNVITNDDEGIIHGEKVKMLPDQTINILSGKYTVCDAEEPHYYIHLTNARVATKPNRKIVFGPAVPVIEGVTLPIGIPFGFIPNKPERATGLLMPTFGEEKSRGFYLRDAGMYFVIGDYFDVSLTGDYYTLGSWAAQLNSRYKVNYKCNGNLAINYSYDQTGEKGEADFFTTTNFGVKWSHTQDPKAHPGTTFSASVNFSSPSNSRYNSRSVTEALNSQTSSSVSWSKNWGGKVNLSLSGQHSQNTRDSSYVFTLPNLSLSVSTFYPFKRKERVGKEKFYEKISIGYNTSFLNKVSFKASEFNMESLLEKFQNGMTHNFSLGLPNFSVFKYINVTPSVSYGMNWFFSKTDYEYNNETGMLVQDKGKAFSSFGITQRYSGSVSISTRLYGMFNFGKGSKIQAIRHVISPSVSISVAPELGTAANGWRTYNYVDTSGIARTYDYNIYSGQLNSPPGKGRSASMSFSIGNNFEAKVRDYADTTGKGVKKVKLIDQLNLSGSYNFLADSMRLSTIGVSMNTTLFDKVSISGNLNLDPYAVNERGTRIGQLSILRNGLAHAFRLTNASASMSYSISGDGSINGDDGGCATGTYHYVYYHPITGEYIPGGWIYYTNPNSPWSLSFNYSFSYTGSYKYANEKLTKVNRFTQTLGLNGSLKLTPKMSINATSGYDFVAKAFSTTQFSATYDLHCFNISVNWVPMGQWQSYSFRIAANASTLADLLRFKKSSSYWDN